MFVPHYEDSRTHDAGPELADVAVDGGITKARGGGEEGPFLIGNVRAIGMVGDSIRPSSTCLLPNNL